MKQYLPDTITNKYYKYYKTIFKANILKQF